MSGRFREALETHLLLACVNVQDMKDASARQHFESLIRARSGLNMRQQEAALLDKTLASRMQVHRFSTPEQYLNFLTRGGAEAETEWSRLFVLLTNQESYFFRDPGQLSVIRDHIFPELLKRNRHTRTLRIWSAGCSTGEEPYSLAMMLDEMLPRGEWRVLILGTDLSEAAIERARTGLYGAWSLRALDAPAQERYFLAHARKWEVKPHLRQNVMFAQNNLLLDEFPSRATAIHDMDLIVCRNVFIYFGRDAVARVLRKFSATLRPDGFLVTGHTELHDLELDDLKARTFAQSVIHQRSLAPSPRANTSFVAPAVPIQPATQVQPEPLAPLASGANDSQNRVSLAPAPLAPAPLAPAPLAPAPLAPAPPAPAFDSACVTREARTLIEQGRHGEALEQLRFFLEREPRHLEALCLAAQAGANAGHLSEAEVLCFRAIEVSVFAPLPYQLLARISDERGEFQSAKSLLKKVLYLDPMAVHSYLELSALYAREGDGTRAAQSKRSALGVLELLDDHAPLPAVEFAVETPLSVGEFKQQLQDGD